MSRAWRALLFVVSSLALGCAARAEADACVSPPAMADVQQAAVKVPRRDRGLLWRVEKDGRTSWLYGTIHVGRLEWIVPGPTIARALAGSDTVALELDLSKPEELRAMVPPVDRASADRVLAGGLGDRLRAQLRKACVPDGVSNALRPAMQVMTLVAASARAYGLHPELGIDLLLNGMAVGMGKPVLGLETVQQQLRLLMPADDEEERAMVTDALDELESRHADAILRRLAQAWERGDAGEIAGYAQWCDCLKSPSEVLMLRRLVDDRNPAMADKLAALHDGGRTFFAAVGALHMSGEKSLVDLLRRRGFAVRPVPLAAN